MPLSNSTRSQADRSRARPRRPSGSARRKLADAGPLGQAPLVDGPARGAGDERDRRYRRSLVAADSVSALLALVVAVMVVGDDELRWASLLTAPLVVVISKAIGLYDRDEVLFRKTTLDEAGSLFQLASLYALLAWLLQDGLLEGTLSRSQVVGLWAMLFVFAILARWFARAAVGRRSPPERCLLVGSDASTRHVAERIRGARGPSADLVGHVRLSASSPHGTAMKELERIIRGRHVHRVILAPQTADTEDTLDMIRLVKGLGVRVSLLPRMFEVVGSSVEFDDLDGMTMLGIRRFGMTRSSWALKRGVDVLGSGLGLLAVAPFYLLFAVAVRMSSLGPVFFRQTRVGRDGKRFDMLKFRTMVVGADAMKDQLRDHNEVDGGMFKIADDPRVTPVGRVLRKTSLDELPQLWNVLRGDMSLVGPRPLVVEEDKMVQGWHRRRLHLTPGMTGHWQIMGSTRVPLQEMVKIDYLYVANWSLWTDVKIMLRTIPHMLRARSM